MQKLLPFVLLLIALTGYSQEQLTICNAGFEDGLVNWTLDDNNASVAFGLTGHEDTVFAGSLSLRADIRQVHDFRNRIVSCDSIRLQKGEPYKIEWWMRSSVGGAELKLFVMEADTAFSNELKYITSTDWEYYSANINPSADLGSARIRLDFRDSGVYYLDEFTIRKLSEEAIDFACDTAGAARVEGADIILNSYSLTNFLDHDSSSMYYCSEIFNLEYGGSFYLAYKDQGGSSGSMDAYPCVTAGGQKSGGTYYPGDKALVGMPVKLEDVPPSMYYEWITDEQYALDEDDHWMASINFIFDAIGEELSEPVAEFRDFDIVVKHKSMKFKDKLVDIDRSEVSSGAYWYFARLEDGSLKPWEYTFNGLSYTYAVRYKFFKNSGDKDDKVHVKLIPYGANATPQIMRMNVSELIRVSRDYMDYAALPPAELALAQEKVAVDGTWLKAISAGYEVYQGESLLSTRKFLVSPGVIDTVTACGSFEWNESMTCTQSGFYSDTLKDIAGNDSIAYLELTILDLPLGQETITACEVYEWNGKLLTESGTYTDTLEMEVGCDSIATLDLTIETLDPGVDQDQNVLLALQAGMNYQWLDCANGHAEIPGATMQEFTAPESGLYAVEITGEVCVDTSECVNVETVGSGGFKSHGLTIYPNPAGGSLTVDIGFSAEAVGIHIITMAGERIFSDTDLKGRIFEMPLDLQPGIYVLEIEAGDKRYISRLVKE